MRGNEQRWPVDCSLGIVARINYLAVDLKPLISSLDHVPGVLGSSVWYAILALTKRTRLCERILLHDGDGGSVDDNCVPTLIGDGACRSEAIRFQSEGSCSKVECIHHVRCTGVTGLNHQAIAGSGPSCVC